MRGHGIGAKAQARRHPQPDKSVHNNARLRATVSTRPDGAQAISEHAPTQCGQRRILIPRQGPQNTPARCRLQLRSVAAKSAMTTPASVPAAVRAHDRQENFFQRQPLLALVPGRVDATPARSSSIDPLATSRPWLMIATWLHSRSTISSTCVVRKIVAPRLIIPVQHGLQHSCRNRVHALERLIQKQHLGPVYHCRGQRQLLLHSMREVGHQLLALMSQLHELQQLFACADSWSRGRARTCGPQSADTRAPSAGPAAPCPSGTTPICRFNSSAPALNGWPRISTVPAVGSSNPVSILMVVDLPAPFGPRNPKNCPGATLNLTSSTAVSAPKRRVSPLV